MKLEAKVRGMVIGAELIRPPYLRLSLGPRGSSEETVQPCGGGIRDIGEQMRKLKI